VDLGAVDWHGDLLHRSLRLRAPIMIACGHTGRTIARSWLPGVAYSGSGSRTMVASGDCRPDCTASTICASIRLPSRHI
jgi:hypothetical protein